MSLAIAVLLPLVLGASDANDAKPAPVTLTGQVVCSVCWFEEDRSKVAYGSAADLACAATCARKGITQALAVGPGERAELFVLDGPPPAGVKAWLDLVGKRAEVTGRVREAEGKKTIAVEKSRVVAEPGSK